MNRPSPKLRLLDGAVGTDMLVVEVTKSHGAPAAVFEVRCYG